MPKAPAPQPMPVMPRDDEEQRRRVAEAERAAIAEAKAGGRRSTIVAGMKIAQEEQYGRGLMMQSRRSEAARSLGG